MVQGKLEKPVRMKIMCLITMDAHSRDIVEQLHVEGVKKLTNFNGKLNSKVFMIQEKMISTLKSLMPA